MRLSPPHSLKQGEGTRSQQCAACRYGALSRTTCVAPGFGIATPCRSNVSQIATITALRTRVGPSAALLIHTQSTYSSADAPNAVMWHDGAGSFSTCGTLNAASTAAA